MSAPPLSWVPLRYLNEMIDLGKPTFEEWLDSAVEFGLTRVEIYHELLHGRDLDSVRAGLDRRGLGISLLTTAPDFTHPDPEFREQQLTYVKSQVDVAATIGAPGIRVTVGVRHPEVALQTGIAYAKDCITHLLDYAVPRGIVCAIENHYKDKRWTHPDFAQQAEVFAAVYHALEDTPVMVNFDCSNQIMVHEDPLVVLNEVKDRLFNVHMSDRMPGEYQHTVIGEGAVPYDAILPVLAKHGVRNCVTLEDGNPFGDEGFKRSLAFARAKIRQYWGD